ncbi:hypothetical protein [Sanguibacter sp. HDW7]|uniref:hypothetical protein n=1 Tax=Sanguibacter sp. HDW7 TaxID=2714931 RepID=UPI00140AAA3D|nr:hypothetical protein [Sanguibacter sp. HDW7]QIK83529.1 hypothetical protein G7063_07735 [Sanguibacter sp. HDW7]
MTKRDFVEALEVTFWITGIALAFCVVITPVAVSLLVLQGVIQWPTWVGIVLALASFPWVVFGAALIHKVVLDD